MLSSSLGFYRHHSPPSVDHVTINLQDGKIILFKQSSYFINGIRPEMSLIEITKEQISKPGSKIIITPVGNNQLTAGT